jgi:hypothetical protein
VLSGSSYFPSNTWDNYPQKDDSSLICFIFSGQFPRKWCFLVTFSQVKIHEFGAQSLGNTGAEGKDVPSLAMGTSLAWGRPKSPKGLSNFRDQRYSDAGWAFAKRQSLSRVS